MTDRELLEKAAKAAGYTTRHKWNAERLLIDPPVIALVVHKEGELISTAWNPLTDDGDALRLAVKLHMDFTLSGKHAAVAQAGINVIAQEFCNGDPQAATRRAIVRAAANIGEKS
jgi:tRNA(Arg) A34 adenosine deaminase TadA